MYLFIYVCIYLFIYLFIYSFIFILFIYLNFFYLFADWLQDKAVQQGALVVLDSMLREHASDEDLYHMAVAAFLRIADCGTLY
jgi:hypothetical protein